MIIEFYVYIDRLIDEVPHYIYEVLLAAFCVGAAFLLLWKSKKAWLIIAKLLFVEYLFLIFCSTVIFRNEIPERKILLTPFWSYSRQNLIAENVMNVVVFIPVGFLLFMIRKERIFQFGSWVIAIISGLVLSVSVESSQLIFKKGYAELDDVMHNTLGCFIGCILSLIIVK